jgi:acyl carrier protein
MTRSVQEIQEGIVQRLSRLTGVPHEDIDVREPILNYGLDSVALVAFAADLKAWLGVSLRENPLDEHPTIEALAQFLAEQATE